MDSVAAAFRFVLAAIRLAADLHRITSQLVD